MNNPIRYIDPSGHFLTETIQSFIQQHYAIENVYDVLQEWMANKAWWNLLRAAQGGDILAMMDQNNKLTYYQFDGKGEEWSNISQVGDVVGSNYNGTHFPVPPNDVERKKHYGGDWVEVGLWRMKDGHLYHVGQFDRRGFSTGTTITAEDVRQADSIFSGEVGAVFSVVSPGGWLAKIIAGFITGYASSYKTLELNQRYGVIEGNDQFLMGRYYMDRKPYIGTYNGRTGELDIR